MKGTHLGEFEELVILVVASLAGNAYAVSVKDELADKVNRKTNISAVHSTLYRLEDKGLLESEIGGATNTRGGKSKRIFKVTAYGFKALNDAEDQRAIFRNLIPQLSGSK